MAKLYITEFGGLQPDPASPAMPAAVTPPLADQVLTFTNASVQSAAFGTGTRVVRLIADGVCSVKFGDAPTATASTMRLAANVPEYFQVRAGQKLAVIENV